METTLQAPSIATSPNTGIEEINRIFQLQQANRQNIKNTTASQRRKKLRDLKNLIFEQREAIQNALHADFRKPAAETDITEIYPAVSEIRHAMANVADWMRPVPVDTPLSYIGSSSKIIYEPKGVVLIISPWNYPFNLCIIPLATAIAAGNCVIIKPSEYTPNTSKLVKSLLGKLFQENEVAVIEGDHRTSTELLKLKFDHIFFTGSPQVGKVVMKAASEHLTSVTLELGGKSPVIVDETANVKTAAKRIAWGKYLNNGQTCIAPDYLFVHESKYDAFVEEMKKNISHSYGEQEEQRATSPDYCRIVNSRHHGRIKQLIENAVEEGANVAIGGKIKDEENYISPTILTNVPADSKIMQEEIFGPVLPIHKYSNIEEPLKMINSKEKPLALYIFSTRNSNIEKIINNTTAGGTTVNDTLLHVNHPNLPFGGVNNSGIGSGHGIFGFKAFSHERAIMKQPALFSAAENMYPPYNKLAKKMIELTLKYL
ncbi:MAG: aldehyde dehydrogenase family protein [Chitinophagales bacterium]|nr:aldehyde dehydrogenase family protein [Chitinophagales bacterium]